MYDYVRSLEDVYTTLSVTTKTRIDIERRIFEQPRIDWSVPMGAHPVVPSSASTEGFTFPQSSRPAEITVLGPKAARCLTPPGVRSKESEEEKEIESMLFD